MPDIDEQGVVPGDHSFGQREPVGDTRDCAAKAVIDDLRDRTRLIPDLSQVAWVRAGKGACGCG
jgi:hypothetical protein